MKLYYGTSTAWTGELIYEIILLCGEHYQTNNPTTGISQTYANFKTALNMAAEAILTKNSDRNYRYTIETYFHQLSKPVPSADEQFWNWGQFVLKGRIPFGKSGYYTIQLTSEQISKTRCLVLEVGCHGQWDEVRRRAKASKIKTWRQDILVAWLYNWNWEVLRLPLAADGNTLCLGEFLASELYNNCGDEAGRNATLDAVLDRGERWLIS